MNGRRVFHSWCLEPITCTSTAAMQDTTQSRPFHRGKSILIIIRNRMQEDALFAEACVSPERAFADLYKLKFCKQGFQLLCGLIQFRLQPL